MKKLKTIVTILFLSLMICGMTSCEVSRHSEGHRRHDHDDHRGGAVILIDKDHHDDHHDDH